MARYRLRVEYDGGPFCGWQAQAKGASVQGALEVAIARFSGETVRIHAAGRTDAGVHATGQVVHLDLQRDWPARTVREAINALVAPAPIVVLAAEVADAGFHARFSAVGRRYLYRILNREAGPALERGKVWWVRKTLDVAAMADAAHSLIGQHDFTTFRDAACQSNSPVKSLDEATIEGIGEEVRLRFAARSFLHRQVRSMTGSLVQVGLGRWSVEAFRQALHAAERSRCGPVAPPGGLYLTEVVYPSASVSK